MKQKNWKRWALISMVAVILFIAIHALVYFTGSGGSMRWLPL